MESYGRFAEVYDRLMADMPYEEWTAFAEEAWRRYGGGKLERVVDLGCGTGNISLPLAAQGYEVTGIDLSETMLAIAQNKTVAHPPLKGNVQWVCQDMRRWSVPDSVDAVVSFCDCLNYITEQKEVMQVLQATYDQLRPGGMFLFDVLSVRQFEEYANTQPFAYDEEDIAYIWFSDFDEGRKEIEHQLTLFVRQENGGLFERVDEAHVQRAYDITWLAQCLRDAGFNQVETFADFTWEQPSADAQRIFFVAVKEEAASS